MRRVQFGKAPWRKNRINDPREQPLPEGVITAAKAGNFGGFWLLGGEPAKPRVPTNKKPSLACLSKCRHAENHLFIYSTLFAFSLLYLNIYPNRRITWHLRGGSASGNEEILANNTRITVNTTRRNVSFPGLHVARFLPFCVHLDRRQTLHPSVRLRSKSQFRKY